MGGMPIAATNVIKAVYGRVWLVSPPLWGGFAASSGQYWGGWGICGDGAPRAHLLPRLEQMQGVCLKDGLGAAVYL